MKFTKVNCHFSPKEKNGISLDVYYYPYEETDQVCPNNFSIPKREEWEKYLDMILGERNASFNVFTSEDFNSSRYQVASGYSFTDIDFKFIMDPNPLNFRPSGWMQGNKLKLKEGLTFWLRNGQTTDNTWHTHVLSTNKGIINHTHDHHIKDKPKKTRKFVVRCLKE